MDMLDIREADDVIVVTFKMANIVDEPTIRKIGAEFEKLTLESTVHRKLLLNFQGVTFLGSYMISQIMRLHKMCQKDQVTLKLCNISPKIYEVFQITMLHKVLSIYDTVGKALSAFNSKLKRWFGGR